MTLAETPVVVDASVGLKWVLPEPGAPAARRLRSALVAGGAAAYVPELFWAETSSALWRLTRAGALTVSEARALFEALLAAPLRSERLEPLASRALEIACATGATTYDASYVALAELYRARVWTADARLADAVAGSAWSSLVELLAD